MKHKHLTLENRIDMQTKLTLGDSLSSIARSLNKSPTTISREIQKHRVSLQATPYGRLANSCKHRHYCEEFDVCDACQYKRPKDFCRFCKHCNQGCPSYEEDPCPRLEKPPYVCNACSEKAVCGLVHKFYQAKEAHLSYTSSWKEDREGFYLTGHEMQQICDLISPRIKQRHSPYAALCGVKDLIPCSISTVYRLIDQGELLARNGDLPRKMRHRPPKEKRPHKVDPRCLEGRTYKDFLAFLEKTQPLFVVEMDTVEGKKGGPVLLSLGWKAFSLIRLHWREQNRARSVAECLDEYERRLGIHGFKELFPVILTDRGTEFSNPKAIEFSPFTGEQRTHVFYCDPQRADQKGSLERNHAEVRRIIPKGSDLNIWSQTSLNDVCDHLNSYPRLHLKGKSPYESFLFFMNMETAQALGWTSVPKEDICLKEDYFRLSL